MNKQELFEAVEAHAIENYENGWDVLIECHTNTEVIEAIGRARTIKGAIKNVSKNLGITIYNDYRTEIQSTAF